MHPHTENRHGGVRSTPVAEVKIFREAKVASKVLERCPHLMSEKTEKNTIKIAVHVVKAYISKSILPTYVRFPVHGHIYIYKCRMSVFIQHILYSKNNNF